jgi:hypothetical protein
MPDGMISGDLAVNLEGERESTSQKRRVLGKRKRQRQQSHLFRINCFEKVVSVGRA